ncbi:MAG TPA: hypothetical protein VE959_32730 [Bryobacteraceae bacterium]|nr:hypothetical protein [Bryobacteraceae bacterium]
MRSLDFRSPLYAKLTIEEPTHGSKWARPKRALSYILALFTACPFHLSPLNAQTTPELSVPRNGAFAPGDTTQPNPKEELLAYRLAAYSEWVRAESGKLTLSGLLAVESARRVPNMPNRTALGRVNAIAPRVEQIVRFPEVNEIQISSDNHYLLVRTSEASPASYLFWGLEQRRVLFTFTADSAIFSPNSAWIAVHRSERPTEILSAADGKRVARLAYAAPKVDSWEAGLHPVVFSHGGRWLAEYTATDELSISSTADWKVKRTIQGVQRFTFGKGDAWIFIVKKDRTADAWNLSNNAPPITLAGSDPVDYALANDQSDIALFGSNEVKEHLQTWSYSGGLQTLGEGFLWTLPEAISDNGKVAVVHHNNDAEAEDDYYIVLRLTDSTVQPVGKMFLRTTPVLTSDGSQLLDPAEGFLYDPATGALQGRFEASDPNNQRTTASSDFQRVAVSVGGKITVYAGYIGRTLPNAKPHAPGDVLNIGRVRPGSWLAKSPDSRFEASADDDNLVLRVWEKGYPYVMLENVQGGDIDFTEDGRYIQRYDLRVEPFLTEDLINETCARMNRNLTSEEWKAYLGSVPYRKTCPAVTEIAGTAEGNRN